MLSAVEQTRLLGLLGGGIVLAALISVVQNLRFLRRSVATAGSVLNIVYGTGEYRHNITVTVAFSLPDGREARFQAGGNPLYSRLVIGQTVPVRYEPDNPSAARINRFLSLWGAEALLALFGALMLALFFSHNGLQAL